MTSLFDLNLPSKKYRGGLNLDCEVANSFSSNAKLICCFFLDGKTLLMRDLKFI